MTTMRRRWVASLLLLAALVPAVASAEAPAEPAKPPTIAPAGTSVSREQLNTRIEQVTAITELDATTTGQLLEQYRKALGFLDAATASSEARDAFARATTEAPAQAKA